jgi:NADH dehydrogenase FAD-containing subunit
MKKTKIVIAGGGFAGLSAAGGGFSGAETTGAINDFVPETTRY